MATPLSADTHLHRVVYCSRVRVVKIIGLSKELPRAAVHWLMSLTSHTPRTVPVMADRPVIPVIRDYVSSFWGVGGGDVHVCVCVCLCVCV